MSISTVWLSQTLYCDITHTPYHIPLPELDITMKNKKNSVFYGVSNDKSCDTLIHVMMSVSGVGLQRVLMCIWRFAILRSVLVSVTYAIKIRITAVIINVDNLIIHF